MLKLTAITRPCYSCSDGQKFDKEADALNHEFKIHADKLIEKAYKQQGIQDIDDFDAARFMAENAREIMELCAEYITPRCYKCRTPVPAWLNIVPPPYALCLNCDSAPAAVEKGAHYRGSVATVCDICDSKLNDSGLCEHCLGENL